MDLLKALEALKGQGILLKMRDGLADGYVFTPEGSGPWPAIIFFMDAFGIRPELFEMAHRLSQQGYYVMLPNLFYRTPFDPFDPIDVFKNPSEKNRLMGVIRSVTTDMVMRDTGVFLNDLKQQPLVNHQKIGCVGYGMGGTFALLTAGCYPDRIGAASVIHASSLATGRPDSPHLLAKHIRAKLYFAIAENDQNFPAAEKSRLESALKDAGVDYLAEIYGNLQQGFALKGTPAYNEPASEQLWEKLFDHFKATLAGADTAAA